MSEREITDKKNKKKLTDLIKENLQKIIIVIVSIVYIFQGIFALRTKDTTIWDILGNIGMSIVVGVIISSSLNSMGLRAGRYGDIFMGSMEAYGLAKNRATPYFDKLSSWCDYKNAQELEAKKKEIIQNAGLNWKAYKFGYYDDEKNLEKLEERQIKALKDVKFCKIYRLVSYELLSDLPQQKTVSIFGKTIIPKRFGEDETSYKTRNAISNLFSRIFMSIICGAYTLMPLINADNKAEIIAGMLWNAMQILMWLTFGIMKYMNAKSFMEDEYRQTHIIQKTELLNEFIITMEKNPSVIVEYDEDAEIDQYIVEYINKMKSNEKQDE